MKDIENVQHGEGGGGRGEGDIGNLSVRGYLGDIWKV